MEIAQKKSQAPVEFMILVGILFFLLFLLGLNQLADAKRAYSEKESELVYDLALKLQEEIRTASLVEDGYARNFTIPSKLENFDYEISIDGGFLSVSSSAAIYTVRVPNATGAVNKGQNYIRKDGGALYLNR